MKPSIERVFQNILAANSCKPTAEPRELRHEAYSKLNSIAQFTPCVKPEVAAKLERVASSRKEFRELS